MQLTLCGMRVFYQVNQCELGGRTGAGARRNVTTIQQGAAAAATGPAAAAGKRASIAPPTGAMGKRASMAPGLPPAPGAAAGRRMSLAPGAPAGAAGTKRAGGAADAEQAKQPRRG